MEVLQVCYVYPPSFSGYGKQLHTLNEYLCKDDEINIEVITAFKGAKGHNVSSFFNVDRPAIENEKMHYYLFAFLSPFKYLKKLLKADLVHIVKAGPEVIFWSFLAKLLGKKIVVKVAQDEVEEVGTKNFLRKLRFQSLKLADKIIALSSKIENELVLVGVNTNKIARINNCAIIDDRNKHELTELMKETLCINFDEKFLISFVGALCRRKGVHDLLAALSSYEGEKPIILFLIGPDYDDIDNLDSLISNVNSKKYCEVIKLGQQDDVRKYIKCSDLLCLPSYSEGMPNVVIESLISGIPVLTSDLPVAKDMINKSNGRLFVVGDQKDLLIQLHNAMNTEFDNDYILTDACNKYSIVSVGEAYKSLYLGLCSVKN
jgi:glycosyltransferase involved in cell wall biosynthesis